MRGITRTTTLIVVVVVAAVILILDQVTKHWAEAHLAPLTPQPLLGEILQLNLLYNSGAAWGMGSGITPVVTIVQIVIAVAVVVFALRSVRSRPYAIALGLVLGGALGNIHDRLLRAPGPFTGWVVDFLQLPHWPIFNVADMGVTGGALLVVLLGLIGRPANPSAAEIAAGSDDPAAPADPATPVGPDATADPTASAGPDATADPTAPADPTSQEPPR
ncbi:signal peptidase II [Brachybacterium sp. MASK1Z-5]|uniref:Lipoprotein signal peptidase n=1 Tax=Brachybacterium halotolerans TaxID=2795215 RepID=A0ABS1B8I6_9MICO|nr:signal peptidase II [Brachybacterium halotolerans]MBK0330507.1 signal peptidase II [Brachybacterium halotolerans]